MYATTASSGAANTHLKLESITPSCHFTTCTLIELEFATKLAAEQALEDVIDMGRTYRHYRECGGDYELTW